MVKTARSHARKAQREKGGWAYRLENLLDEVFSKVEAGGVPRSFSLEEQGLFGIGYHHMRHWLRMSKEERAVWEAEHSDSPRAFIWAKAEEAASEPAAV
jgi:CRISPR-associated protein Csd1